MLGKELQDLAAHVRRGEFADELARQFGLRTSQPGLFLQRFAVRGLLAQDGAVAVGEFDQLPAPEEGQQSSGCEREEHEQANDRPAGVVGFCVALKAQRLLEVDEIQVTGAHVVGDAFAAALADHGRIVAAGTPQRDDIVGITVPGRLQCRDAIDPLDLRWIVGNHLPQVRQTGRKARLCAFIGLQESFVAGDQETAHAGFQVDAQPLHLAGFAGHAVGVLHPADHRQKIEDERHEHHHADKSADQWKLHVAREHALEVTGIDG